LAAKHKKVENKWNAGAHWRTGAFKLFRSRFPMFCNAFSMRPTVNCFQWIESRNCRLAFCQLYILLLVCLACKRHLHAEGDRGIIRKYRNPEARWTRRKVFVAAQKHYWWDGCTRPTHHQLLQLLTVTSVRRVGGVMCHGPRHTLKMKKSINSIRQWRK